MKRTFLALLALLALSSAFAQTKFPLTIICNVMDADVYINNKLYTKTAPNLVIQLPPVTYNIKVAKAGYNEFNASVKVNAGGTTLNVILQPLAAAPAQAPAQSSLPSFPLNVTSNVNGAQVFLSGKFFGSTPFGATVIGGNYELRVTAPGYDDFVQRITVRGPSQFNAMLQGQASTLTISANVNGASVFINGNQAGQTPFSAQMPSGSYTVSVRAPGYADFNQNIVIGNGPLQVNAMLQGMSFQVSVGANVNGALVFINGNQAGQTPFVSMLPQGTYTILVRAAGYLDYQVQVAVNGPQAINAALQPSLATWQLNLPDTIRNKDIKPGQSRAIQVWVDGVLQNEGQGQGQVAANGQLQPGRHMIRMVSGGLAAEVQIEVQAGKAYVFEPFLGINIK